MYVDGVILAALRHYLPGTNIYSRQPADVLDVLPCIVARSYGGGDLHLNLAARPSIQVDSYADDRRPAGVLADQAAAALIAAWRNSYRTPDGVICGVTTTARPAEFPDDQAPSGLVRFTATYQLTIRP
jgi:hypothetical protein